MERLQSSSQGPGGAQSRIEIAQEESNDGEQKIQNTQNATNPAVRPRHQSIKSRSTPIARNILTKLPHSSRHMFMSRVFLIDGETLLV
mmetsp:Transcript_13961/g.15428  ORF Transcript_13961/g.15428 Transcript_13961/m.15428 type:complete len:88 (+) Transcript_13961:69-332(+)